MTSREPIHVTRVMTLSLELEITVNLIKTELTEDKQGLGAQRKTKLPTILSSYQAPYMHHLTKSQTFWVKKVRDFPGGSVVKNLSTNAGDVGSIPGSGRSPGKGTATHPSMPAREIPWTEGPGGLQSMGLQESGMT